MKNKDIAIWIVIVSFGITIFFLARIGFDHYKFWSGHIEFAETGQVGDFIGGVVGTIFSAAGFYFLYLTLNEQRDAGAKQRFESKFFDLIKLHRDNVSELTYKKVKAEDPAAGRKVMRVIVQEFFECYREVRKFSNSDIPTDYVTPQYLAQLDEIRLRINPRISVIELARIDVAYSIVFFGIGIEGEAVLRDRFKYRYNSIYFYRLLAFIKLKPKQDNVAQYQVWEQVRSLNLRDLRNLIEEIYLHRSYLQTPDRLSTLATTLLATNYGFEKYYGGHQHRLGHYFRHLFQSYKFLLTVDFLSQSEKYFYAKTLRGQLSTYEQILIFINSVSSLGMKWEFKFETNEDKLNQINRGLITTYHVIKNVPGNHFFGITYKDYYPHINYENQEDR